MCIVTLKLTIFIARINFEFVGQNMNLQTANKESEQV